MITIRHRAWLAWRSPPGLSRWRVTFPDDAGIGAARAQVRPGGLAAQPLGVVPGGDEQQRGGVGADAVQGEQARGTGGDQGADELVQALELAVEELGAAAQLPQRDAGGVAGTSPGRGRSDASPATRAAGVCPANRARRSSGPVTIRARAWLIAWVRSARALRLATISARIASTAPSRPFGAPRARPDWAARAALTASPGKGGALLRRPPLRTVRATRRGIRLKQAAGACRLAVLVPCAGGLSARDGTRCVRGVFARRPVSPALRGA